MEKTQFKYQRWYLRIFCSGIMLLPVFLLQCLFAIMLDIQSINFWYLLVCGVLAIAGITVFYKYTQHHRWFERQGTYWVENGIVYIEKKSKIHEIKNVTWLRGATVSAYGAAKAGMLVIKHGKEKIVLVSSSPKSVESFADSNLLPLFKTIVEYNPELVKDDILDFWYEIKNK